MCCPIHKNTLSGYKLVDAAWEREIEPSYSSSSRIQRLDSRIVYNKLSLKENMMKKMLCLSVCVHLILEKSSIYDKLC